MTDQLWVSVKVKRGLVLPTVFPATVFGSLLDKVTNSKKLIMKFIILIMIFIHDVYKFIPTYRLTHSGYPTRETIHQNLIGVPKLAIIASLLGTGVRSGGKWA